MDKILLFGLSLLLTLAATAQGVKIGDTQGSPDGSAIFEAQSTTKGMLPPRMTTIERDAIQNQR